MIMCGKYKFDFLYEKYYERFLVDSFDGEWYFISLEFVMDFFFFVQIFNVEVFQFREWVELWVEFYEEDLDSCVFQDKDGNEICEEEDGEGNCNKFICCCGYDCFLENVVVEVYVFGKNKDYVIIYDYFMILYDWLRICCNDFFLVMSFEFEFSKFLLSEM